MNEGSKPKAMGYKQYAIHAGHEHNMVELAMREDARHAKQIEPVLEALAAARLAEVRLLTIPNSLLVPVIVAKSTKRILGPKKQHQKCAIYNISKLKKTIYTFFHLGVGRAILATCSGGGDSPLPPVLRQGQ